MNDLQTIIFEATQAAVLKYLSEARDIGQFPNSSELAELEVYRQRFCALMDVIEQAGLEDSYAAWKHGENEEED